MRTTQKVKQPKTFEGTPCRTCGGTERYSSNNNCVTCKHNHNISRPYDHQSKWGPKWAKKHPDYTQVQNCNARAKKYGVEGIITLEEWITLKKIFDYTCLCCCIREEELTGSKWNRRLTIDHVIPITDPCCTNTVDNIQILCFSCNCKKREHSWDFRGQKKARWKL